MPTLRSLNIGRPRRSVHSDMGVTGIDKRPTSSSVLVRAPGPRGTGGSGVCGDEVSDRRHHGGDDQAVYAYPSEDLAYWAGLLTRELPPGSFGENLTTSGLDITLALIGQRWRIGEELVLEISAPRIPCRTFAGWLGENGWVKRFTQPGRPGAYLRVIEPGTIRAGDHIEIISNPAHDVTVGIAFRALTTERDLLPRLIAAHALPDADLDKAKRAAEVAAR